MAKKILYTIETDASGAITGIKAFGAAVDGVAKKSDKAEFSFGKMNRTLKTVLTGFGAVGVINLAVSAFKSLADANKDLKEKMDAAGDAAERTKGKIAETVNAALDLAGGWWEASKNSRDLEGNIIKTTTATDVLNERFDKATEKIRALPSAMDVLKGKYDDQVAGLKKMESSLLATSENIAAGSPQRKALEKDLLALAKSMNELNIPTQGYTQSLVAQEAAMKDGEARRKKAIDDKKQEAEEEKKRVLEQAEAFSQAQTRIADEMQKGIDARIAAEEKGRQDIAKIRDDGLQNQKERLDRELSLFAGRDNVSSKEIEDAQFAVSEIKRLDIEALNNKRDVLFAEYEAKNEAKTLTAEDDEIFSLKLQELNNQEADVIEAAEARKENAINKVKMARIAALQASIGSLKAGVQAGATAALGEKKAAKILALITRVEEGMKAKRDFAEAATKFASQNYLQGAMYVVAGVGHVAAAAFAGNAASSVGAARGGRVPSVAGVPNTGDFIPAGLEAGEVIIPRPFADEFSGFAEMLKGQKGGGSIAPVINIQFSGNTMLTDNKGEMKKFMKQALDTADEMIRGKQFAWSSR